jgi:drug/metabolite transporter (DMT)-like permease
MIFKYFPKYNIDTFQAIVTNYFVCVICGAMVLGRIPFDSNTLTEPWLPFAGGLGILFISGFYSIGMTVLFFGLTVASVLQKMSLVISVPFAIIAFSESATLTKVIGLILALIAVVLSNWPQKNPGQTETFSAQKSKHSNLLIWFFPIYAFLASGVIECGIQYVQSSILRDPDADAEFSSAIFAAAGIIGIIVTIYLILTKKTSFSFKNIVAGIFLGVPNYFSIYFLLKAFSVEGWNKSVVLPVNNISIVIISTFLGIVLFNEKLSLLNWIGVILATLAILLIGL